MLNVKLQISFEITIVVSMKSAATVKDEDHDIF